MIELIKSVSMGHDYYDLFIDDDELTDRVELDVWGGFQGAPISVEVTVREPEIIERLVSHSFSELPEELEHLNLESMFDSDLVRGVSVSRVPTSRLYGSFDFVISFEFGPILSNWPRGYDYKEYYDEIRRLVEATNEKEIQPEVGYIDRAQFNTSGIRFIASPDLSIASEISRCSNILREVNNVVERTLAWRVHSDSIVMAFDFPEEVKVPCEQYLLYFVQFLRDLGIEATSELSNKAGQVLFTVTPTDKQEALNNIRTALEIYVCLPASTIVTSPEVGDDMVIMRLIENVQFLKRQLELSHDLLQGREAALQAQEIVIDQQQRLLSGHVLLESLMERALHPREEGKEELLGGLVTVTKYKGKVFELDIPKVVRRLRRLFAKDKRDSP